MTILITDVETDVAVIAYCPLCGAVLDPDAEAVLCADCQADEDEKWQDYVAEQVQACRPF